MINPNSMETSTQIHAHFVEKMVQTIPEFAIIEKNGRERFLACEKRAERQDYIRIGVINEKSNG